MYDSTITAIRHRFILGTHNRQKLYQKNICERFILGSQRLLIDNSIKQNTPYLTNYQINSVHVGNINVAIRRTFILGKNKNSVMLNMIQKNNTYRYVGKNTDGELVFNVDSKSSNKTYTIIVSITHDDSLSSVPTYQIRHEDEDECMGYKNRANCWHINDIQLDECCLCLTPLYIRSDRDKFLDQYDNTIHRVIHSDNSKPTKSKHDGNKISIVIHDYCLKALNELDDECDYI